MEYIVKIEGQDIPVPEEIGSTDQALKMGLRQYYPDVENAMITRVVNGDTTIITVVKKAGPKGQADQPDQGGGVEGAAAQPPLQTLIEAKGGKNPAVELYEKFEALGDLLTADPAEVLALQGQIQGAMQDGADQGKRVQAAYDRLRNTKPAPAPGLVMGF